MCLFFSILFKKILIKKNFVVGNATIVLENVFGIREQGHEENSFESTLPAPLAIEFYSRHCKMKSVLRVSGHKSIILIMQLYLIKYFGCYVMSPD